MKKVNIRKLTKKAIIGQRPAASFHLKPKVEANEKRSFRIILNCKDVFTCASGNHRPVKSFLFGTQAKVMFT